MLVNKHADRTVEWLRNNNPTNPNVIAVGTSNTTPTVADTDLGSPADNRSTVNTKNNSTNKYAATFPGFDSDIQDSSLTEVGLFDTTGRTNMSTRDTMSGFSVGSSNQYNIKTGFVSLIQLPHTNAGRDELVEFYNDNTGNPPTHIAWSTHYILDKMDSPTGWNGTANTTATGTSTNNREGTFSLTAGKLGTAGTVFGYNKAVTSVDISSAEEVRFWVNILDSATLGKLRTGTAMEVRVGSGAGAYRFKGWDKADLIVGWQRLDTNIVNMGTQGSPDLTATDFVEVLFNTAVGTSTVTSGKILMDYPHAQKDNKVTQTVLENELDRNTTGTVDVSADTTTRHIATLALAEGNTNNIGKSGLFDAASNGNMLMISEDVVTRKDSSIKIRQEFDWQTNINEDDL